MLRFLRIRNLAVVESVDVEFEPGFNVLTGETGAGKSIIVEAVGLLLGDRASSDLVRTGETQATIEAIFEVSGTAGAEPHELIIRRDITDHGRSRSFINGALATAGALRDLSQRLVLVLPVEFNEALRQVSQSAGCCQRPVDERAAPAVIGDVASND